MATGFAAADDAAVAVGQLAEQVEVLVVDEHRTRTDAVDADRVFLDNAAGGSRFALGNHVGTYNDCSVVAAAHSASGALYCSEGLAGRKVLCGRELREISTRGTDFEATGYGIGSGR